MNCFFPAYTATRAIDALVSSNALLSQEVMTDADYRFCESELWWQTFFSTQRNGMIAKREITNTISRYT